MVLDLVRKSKTGGGFEWIRMLEPTEEDAVRAAKGREADEVQRDLYLRTVSSARDDGGWFLCDCRYEGSERPVIVPIRKGPERFSLGNRPNSLLPHAEGCVFALTEDEEDRPAARRRAPPRVHDDRLDPFAPAEKAAGEDEDGSMGTGTPRSAAGLSAASRHRTVSNILRTLMQTARLNTLRGADRFRSPGDWLPEIAHAAEQFFIAEDVPASDFLFTDPADWTGGEVARRLAEAEPDWPRGEVPFGMLCWTARDLGDNEINPAHRDAGHVAVASGVGCPVIGRSRVAGPWLFLGIVARPVNGGPWECLDTWAQPIVALQCPVPVDSAQERRAFDALRRLVSALEDDARLRHAFGGGLRIELEKPLTEFRTMLGPCLPDFLVTVAPQGARDDAAAGRRDGCGWARYIVEVMGFDDPDYEQKKSRTHARMRHIGRLFRMEATEFDSSHNGIERQAGRIASDIANDLLRRMGPASGA